MENCDICEKTRYCVKYNILFLPLKKITIYCIFLLTTTKWSGMIFLVAVRLPIKKIKKENTTDTKMSEGDAA